VEIAKPLTIRLAAARSDEPFATTVMRCASDPTAEFVVLSATERPALPVDALLRAWSNMRHVSCFVPKVVSDLGRLLEAGADIGPDGLLPRGAGASPASGSYLSRRHVDGTTFPWAAVRRQVFDRVALSPSQSDVSVVVGQIVDAAAEVGHVVYEPGWVVDASDAPGRRIGRVTTARQGPPGRTEGDRLLVLPGALPRDLLSPADRYSDQLITSLVETCTADCITVLASSDHLARRRLANYRDLGVEVHVGAIDLQRWFSERWGQFSHIFLAGTSTSSSVRHWIEETQPQAARILAFVALPFRDVETLRAVTPQDELPGLDWVRTLVEARVAMLARWADAAWCQQGPDVAYLHNFLLDKEAVHLPSRLEASGPPAPRSTRSGLLLFAANGEDVVQGNEDAAIAALRDVVPWLRKHVADLPVRIISGAPSPLLRSVAEESGATIVRPETTLTTAATARLILVAQQFGTGGAEAIQVALATGTPVIVTPHASRGTELGGLSPFAVFGAPVDIRQQCLSILTDDLQWDRFAAEIQAHAVRSSEHYLPDLRTTLARSGITPVPEGTCRLVGTMEVPEPWEPVPTSTRPHDYVPRPAPIGLPEEHVDEAIRYKRWRDRFGGTDEVLTLLAREVQSLEHQPLISIIMPVFNTDPLVLEEAIDSVRSQIYSNWQLCVVDDGSTSPATRHVLEQLSPTGAITVLRLGGQSGISAATNAGLDVATGEFVTFLDHDDVLKPHALAQVVRWLNADPTLDVLYSDEDKLDPDGNLFQPHLKPDWSPNQLMSQN
jgi:hypothetical protein